MIPVRLGSGRGRSEYLTFVIDHPWKTQPEDGALSRLTGKVDCTIVQLNHPKSGGQPDSGAVLFRCEVQLKHAVLNLRRDSRTAVVHREQTLVAVRCGAGDQRSALLHSFQAVVDDVQNRL